MTNKHRYQNGFLLVTLMIVTTFIVAAGLITIQLALSNLQLSAVEQYRVNAQLVADAGLDHAIQNLNQDGDWAGSGSEITLYEDDSVKTTFQTTVVDGSDITQKFIDVTARVYAPKTNPSPRIERKYRVELRGVTSGDFSVVTGVGGLVMSNNAKIVGGNVYVNGSITMSNSSQIGLTTNPVTVKAAHQNCPIPATGSYPRVCNSGENGEPINFSNSAKIYGEVQATNQTDGGSMFSPGLVPGSPAPSELPTHDRAALKAAITSTVTGASAGCSSGTKTWAANLKITGNVSISNTCKVTVLGDIWITGNLSMSNSSQLIVSNARTDPPVIMVDGSSGASISNAAQFKSNTQPTPVGFRLITYWSNAACSPDCSDVTGTDLYNSRNHITINLSNNTSGPQTEFYARWSKVTISNSGNIGALVGQTVELTNSGAVTFGATVTGVGGIEAWVVKSYKRTF